MLQSNHGIRSGGKAPAMASSKRNPATSGISGSTGVGAGGVGGRTPYKPPSTDFGDIDGMRYANSFKGPVANDSASVANDDLFSEFGGGSSAGGSGMPRDSSAKTSDTTLNFDDDFFMGSAAGSAFDAKPKGAGSRNDGGLGGSPFADDDAFSASKPSAAPGLAASASHFDNLLGVGSLQPSSRTEKHRPVRNSTPPTQDDLLGGFRSVLLSQNPARLYAPYRHCSCTPSMRSTLSALQLCSLHSSILAF